MKLFLLELNKKYLDLSIAEIMATHKIKKHVLFDKYLLIYTNKTHKNLALTKKIIKVISISNNIKDFFNSVKLLKKEYRQDFKLFTENMSDKKKDILNKIFNIIKNAKTNLTTPKTKVYAIKLADKENTKYILGIEEWCNKEEFNKRNLKNLPEKSPTATDPRIARAMINLAKCKKIIDPFCGTGGILIEAGLMKKNITGFEIDRITFNKAKINIKYMKIKAKVLNIDALTNKKKFKCVVTDLPYGKNSKTSKEINKLYKEFFEKYYKLTTKMIVGLPKRIKPEIYKWEIENFFDIYIHKNMTKRIYVLTKK